MTRRDARIGRRLTAGVFGSIFVGSLLAQLGSKLSVLTPLGDVFQAFYVALAISLIATGIAQIASKAFDFA